ncbi:MAG: hypothetical protein LWW86_11740 [Micrococcales bacterium]|nr:hypothetical protein [Micrococcales bacterium]
MILLGLLLILLAIGLGALLYLATYDQTGANAALDLDAGPFSASVHPLWLVIGGALAMLLLWMGWALIRASARSKAKRRRENKELERQAQADRAERERLAAQQTRERQVGERERFDTGSTAEGRYTDRERY